MKKGQEHGRQLEQEFSQPSEFDLSYWDFRLGKHQCHLVFKKLCIKRNLNEKMRHLLVQSALTT